MWNVWGRLGLRARIMGLYALGGLLLSLMIAVATLTLARQNLLEDREDRAFPVAVRNATRVEGALSGETEIEDIAIRNSGTDFRSLQAWFWSWAINCSRFFLGECHDRHCHTRRRCQRGAALGEVPIRVVVTFAGCLRTS